MRGCLYRDTDIDIVNKTGRKPFLPELLEKNYWKKKNTVKGHPELWSPFAFKGCTWEGIWCIQRPSWISHTVSINLHSAELL